MRRPRCRWSSRTRSACRSSQAERDAAQRQTARLMGETYEAAGVSIAAGEEASSASRTRSARPFAPRSSATSADSVASSLSTARATSTRCSCRPPTASGTKALVAQAAGRFDTIGVDLVAMCVDDIVCQGAEPLFFLDYIAVGSPRSRPHRATRRGRRRGLPSGRLRARSAARWPSTPGAMEPGEFDLVGFAVGVVERDRIITGAPSHPATSCFGLPSTNLRSNGYSLARRVLFDVRVVRSTSRRMTARITRWPTNCSSRRSSTRRPSWRCSTPSTCAASPTSRVAGITGNLARVLPDGHGSRARTAFVGGAPHLRRAPDPGRDRRRRDGQGVQPRPRHDRGGTRGRGLHRARRAPRATATAPARSARSSPATARCTWPDRDQRWFGLSS